LIFAPIYVKILPVLKIVHYKDISKAKGDIPKRYENSESQVRIFSLYSSYLGVFVAENQSKTTIYAKQSQFAGCSNERKYLYRNELRTTNYEL